MNVASAGPLVCAWLHWRGKKSGQLSDQLGRSLAWWSVITLVIGMLSGGLLLLVIPGNGLSVALAKFPPSTYWFAGAELVFSLACMIAIAGGWRILNKWWIALLAFATAANLLYHFPPLMAVMGHLAADEHWTTETIIDRPILLKLITRGEVLPLTVHFGLSALAVAGVAVLFLLTRLGEQTETAQEAKTIARGAALIALTATLLQVPIGVWLLSSLSAPARARLMGMDLWASLAFLVGLAASIVLMQRLLTVVLGETDRKNLRHIVAIVCGVVLLMTASLRLSRPVAPVAEAATKTASSANAQG